MKTGIVMVNGKSLGSLIPGAYQSSYTMNPCLTVTAKMPPKSVVVLSEKQKSRAKEITSQFVGYSKEKFSKVPAEEWVGLGSSVFLAVSAALRKDTASLMVALQDIGRFCLRNLLPDFMCVIDGAVIAKSGDTVGVKVEEQK